MNYIRQYGIMIYKKFTKIGGTYVIKVATKMGDVKEVDFHVYEPVDSMTFYIYYYKVQYYAADVTVVHSTRTVLTVGQEAKNEKCGMYHPQLLDRNKIDF